MTVQSHPPNLIFEEVFDPEVIRFTLHVNSEAWKGVLTNDEYVDRELVLGSSDICTKYTSGSEYAKRFPESHNLLGIKYFVLKDTSLPSTDKMSQIVSRCETLNRLGSCITPNSKGKIEPSLTICIGGVFTPIEYRGKGYAKIMIEKLNSYYDDIYDKASSITHELSRTLVRNMVINLYSEVGEYYSKMGYVSKHVPIHDIPGLDTLNEEYCKTATVTPTAGRMFKYDDYTDMIDLQSNQFKNSLVRLAKDNPEGFTFTVDADIDIFKWFEDRDIFIFSKLLEKKKSPFTVDDLRYGYAITDGEYKDAHIIWHHSWNGNELIITKIYISEDRQQNADDIAKILFGEAIKEAKKFGLTKLEFWDEEIPANKFPELFTVLENMSKHESKTFLSNGSLSAVRPPHGIHPELVRWDNNTKFCWF